MYLLFTKLFEQPKSFNFYCVIVSAAGVFCCYFILGITSMSATWSYPYFSGAANLFEHGSWFINTEQLQQFYQLDQSDFPYFNFEASDSITEYNYNAVGYVYIVSAAQFIFPFLTQMQSVVLFQAIIHLVFVGWVLNSLDSSWAKVIFTLLYALNPLVLKFVLFAFYYFWQVIPSIAFLILAIF